MIRQKQNSDKMIIDLDGPDGNAYNLLGVANNLMRKGFGNNTFNIQYLYKGKEKDYVLKEMTSGDYNNLVKVFDKHFGDMVILEYSGFREVK